MGKAQKLKYQLDNFVEKMAGVNKPYLALKKTPEYKAFHEQFKTAIKSQADWVAEHMGEVGRHGDAATYIERNMPNLNTLITQQSVSDYFTFCFEWGAKAQYQRWGLKIAKAAQPKVDFKLTNQKYLSRLEDDAAYLLNQSSIDDTTRGQIIKIIQDGRNNVDDDGEADPLTNDEIGQQISDGFDDISSSRADMIARTESASAMGDGNYATMEENNVQQVDWVTAGDNPCPICEENEDASPINVGDTFPSGDTNEPAHPNCECYTQADPDSIDLDSMSIWDGGDTDDE